jgi:hypothetical protein
LRARQVEFETRLVRIAAKQAVREARFKYIPFNYLPRKCFDIQKHAFEAKKGAICTEASAKWPLS